MKKLAILIVCLNVSVSVNAQFRASVECKNFLLVQDSTYTGDLKKFVDQTNNNYLPSQVQKGYILTDANFRIYRVDTISSTTFSSLSGTFTKIEGKNLAPTGKGQISENLKEGLLAVTPDNQSGVSPAVKASIESRNYKRQADSLSYLLNNSIDSIKVENDSISVYWHRKIKTRIAASGGSAKTVEQLTAISQNVEVSFDLPLTNIEGLINVNISGGYECLFGYDYSITNNGTGQRRVLVFNIPVIGELVTVEY